MRAFFVQYCFVIILALSSSVESLEHNYPFREIQKPIATLESAEKIIVLSVPRTGSTLTYMIFQYLFEEKIAHRGNYDKKVVKTHDVKECDTYCSNHPNTHVIISIRNPLDSFLSKIKALASLKFLPPNKDFIYSLLQIHIKEHLALWEFIQKYQSEKLLIVRFENFHNNLDSLLSCAEKEFSIIISENAKTKIHSLFSKQSILEICKQFPNFIKQDPITGLHGQHIQNNTSTLNDYVSDELLEQIHKQLQPIMQLYGYESL